MLQKNIAFCLRVGLSTALLVQIAELLAESSSVLDLPRLFFRDVNILTTINFAVISILAFTAIGLWFGLRQAWVSAMVLIGIGLVYNIWSYLEGTPLYLNMVFNVFAVFYLNERSVQAYFERRPPGQEGRP